MVRNAIYFVQYENNVCNIQRLLYIMYVYILDKYEVDEIVYC